jgi:hypothetical protein
MIRFFRKLSIVACSLLFCLLPGLYAQDVFSVKTGMETWTIRDELSTLGSSSHPGQFFGFDVYVEKNRALFVPGFHYHRISVLNEDHRFSYNFSEAHHMHYFTIPLSFGYQFLDYKHWNMAALGGGEINFFYDLDANDVGLDDDQFYGIWTGLTAILQSEIASRLTAEIKYHYAIQPILKTRPQSKLRGWTLAMGIRF